MTYINYPLNKKVLPKYNDIIFFCFKKKNRKKGISSIYSWSYKWYWRKPFVISYSSDSRNNIWRNCFSFSSHLSLIQCSKKVTSIWDNWFSGDVYLILFAKPFPWKNNRNFIPQFYRLLLVLLYKKCPSFL